MSCTYLLYFANKESDLAKKVFYKNPPDLIAVYTGDSGRIPFALELNKDFKTQVFISGVYTRNNIQSLLNQYSDKVIPSATGTPTAHQEFLNPNIEIDYLAHNTFENVLSTLRYLRKNHNMKQVLVISSDYHLFRIEMILKTLNKNSNVHYYYRGVSSGDNWFRRMKLLYKEGFKILRTWMFLLLWENESLTPIDPEEILYPRD